MTMRQTYGNWVQPAFTTALATLANANTTTTSSRQDNSSQRSYAMDVSFTWGKNSGTGTGTIEIWLLPEGNNGSAEQGSAPPRGGRLIGVVSTAAETTVRNQLFRVNELPEKFDIFVDNESGVALANADLRYRWVDFVDV